MENREYKISLWVLKCQIQCLDAKALNMNIVVTLFFIIKNISTIPKIRIMAKYSHSIMPLLEILLIHMGNIEQYRNTQDTENEM